MIIQYKSNKFLILDIIKINLNNKKKKIIKLVIQNLFYQEEKYYHHHHLIKLKLIHQINKLVSVQQMLYLLQ